MSSLRPVRALSPSEAVVEEVAARENVDPIDLSPLYETIDAEALDALVESNDRPDADLRIEFNYQDYDVTVDGDGVVDVDSGT